MLPNLEQFTFMWLNLSSYAESLLSVGLLFLVGVELRPLNISLMDPLGSKK